VYSVLTKVPEYRYPLYRSTGIRFKKVVLKGYIYNPSNNKNIQPVHEDSKIFIVDLGRTELGTLRTCARVPRARARAARAKKNPPALQHYYFSAVRARMLYYSECHER
jgi:hypothetical protein